MFMYGYVYLSSGAVRTNEPGKYPARQQQLENLDHLKESLGLDEMKIAIEKAPVVEGLSSLPILRNLLQHAASKGTRVVIDDFRRLFLKAPIRCRLPLLKELLKYGTYFSDMCHEGVALSQMKRESLVDIADATSRVDFRLRPKTKRKRSETLLRRQTRAARAQSAANRKVGADRKAEVLERLRAALLKQRAAVTHRELAEEANARGLKTARGNDWSAATVSRALKRLQSEPTFEGKS